MSTLHPEPFYRRNLPHIHPSGATFFVTFRLAGSIPVRVLAAMREEVERSQAELERMPDSQERRDRLDAEQRRQFGKWDAALHAGHGPRWLQQPQLASVVVESLRHFDGARYDLLAYCIMPNHVHVVLTPLLNSGQEHYSLAQIMHSIKGYSATRANALQGRTGAFWQHENYDHYVRDDAELDRIVRYVLNNPVKAGLVEDWVDWPWTYCKGSSEEVGAG